MKIWVLVKKNWSKKHYEFKRFKEEAKKNNIDLKFVSCEEFEIIEPRASSLERDTIFHKQKAVKLPDCLIPRRGSYSTYFDLAVIRMLEKRGVFTLNRWKSIANAKDKLRATQILSAKDIPIPKTMLAKFPISEKIVKKEFGFPLIIKTISGSFGMGVLLCENSNQLSDILALAEETSKGNMNVILQEFVSTSRGKDIRVIVLGGKAIGAILRTGKRGNFKANFSAGGSVEEIPLTPELEWLASESARALGLENAGVDILFDKGNYKVCEVNSAPGFEGFKKATGINVPKEIFNFIKVRIGSLET